MEYSHRHAPYAETGEDQPNGIVGRVRRTVSATIQRQGLLQPGASCLVALSGGMDSVVLLHCLKALGYDVVAAHCNFNLRGGESQRDQQFCEDLCKRMEVRIAVRHFGTTGEAKAHGESIEMAARRLRYAWFEELVAEEHFEAVAVGHHREDNVETFLLNLTRGTGIHGLTGMAYKRGHVIRPMLGLTREDIEQYVAEMKLGYIFDSSNSDEHYKRNFVRHTLLADLERLNPSVRTTIERNIDRLKAAAEAYDYLAGKLFTDFGTTTDYGYRFTLGDKPYGALFDEIGRQFGFNYDTVQAFRTHWPHSDRAVFYSQDFAAAVYRGRIDVCRKPQDFEPMTLPLAGNFSTPDGKMLSLQVVPRETLGAIPKDPHTAALDFDRIQGSLVLRPLVPGDRFVPFGMKGTKLVSDFLTDRHVSHVERKWVRAVADNNGILWLVGHRPDARAAISKATRQVLLITTKTTKNLLSQE